MEFQDLVTFGIVFLAICGAITAVLTAAEKISKIFHPYRDHEERLTNAERRLDNHDKYFDNDNKQLKELARLSKRSFQLDLVLLNHFIDGNGVEEMKKLRESLQNDIIEADW